MQPFTGEFELTIDEKNRLSVPAKLRDQLTPEDQGFYQTLGVNRVLCLYPESSYQRIALAVAPRKVAPDESLAFDRVNSALASKVGLDRQGRLLLNDRLIRRAGLSGEVTLIGVRDHLELWDRSQWENYLDEHLRMHEAMLLQAHEQARQAERQQAGLES